MKLRNRFASAIVYVAVIGVSVYFAATRAGAQDENAGADAQAGQTAATTSKPYFSLSTNRTYSTADKARVWINYVGVEHLDFRVYRVSDPAKFFKGLADPHKMGEQEKLDVAASIKQGPSLIEKIRDFKVSVYKSIKSYFRSQLRRESRESLNQKFRGEGDRVPLNVADYARVPLLNPDQLVNSWRERLQPLDNLYDARMVMLGRRDPGVYLVEAVNGGLRAYTVALVSDLTLINKTAPTGEMLVFAVDRKSGAPREGVQVEISRSKKTVGKGTTDKNGILKTRVEMIRQNQPEAPEDADPEAERTAEAPNSYLVMARHNDHFALSDLQPYYFGLQGGEGEEEGLGGMTGYIYTDRPVYRPAQKVYFKGILRRQGEAGYDVVSGPVNVTVEDPNGGKVLQKDSTLSARGTFSGDVDIAAGAPLGSYRIIAGAGSTNATSYFEVEEYKKPEYKVTVSTPKKFVPVGDKVRFTIEARYFFGEPVTKADVTYYIYRSHYYHWWETDEDEVEAEDEEASENEYGYGNDMVKDGEATLNAQGILEVEFEVPTNEEKNPYDYTYRLEAQVTDEARRTIEARASVVGTRGSVIGSTHTDRYVYYEGDNAKIQVRTTDYEGRPVAAMVTLGFVSRSWERVEKEDEEGKKRFEYVSHDTNLATAELKTDQQGTAVYEYRVPAPGGVIVTTTIDDGKKEFVSDTGYIYVADRKNQWSDWAYEDYGAIKLVPDKKSYQPGETAHVLAMLPTDKAHLLVTTELSDVMTARHIEASGRAVMIDVPIEARYAPNVYLSVAYVRDGDMYTHDRLINVPARNKFLSIEILADKKEYKPRETARYTVLARNNDGSPASGAEVSMGVVDEAIYSVKPDQTPDIRKAFYGRRYNQVQTTFTISYYFTGFSGDKPVNLAATKPSYQLADFKNQGQYAEPTIRKDFRDTTFWQPDIITGADGKATVEVKLPDNLTTWRATARAVTGDTRVGAALVKVVSRKDLILRLATPRFLTEGDTVTLSAVVHNYLDSAKATKISIEVTGARLLDQAATTVTISKQGEHRIDWRVGADNVGEIKLLAKALTDQESDAVEIPLEVVPHGLKQSAGGATTISDESADRTIAIDLPAGAHPQARSLRIEATPSVAGTLLGALDYLTSYPYGCTEQTMSSFLPNVIVAQTVKDVQTASIRGSNDLAKKVQRGLDRLYGFQHDDGGWGWWKDDQTDPFMTAYVIDGLTMASRAGYSPDGGRIARGREKLREMIAAGSVDGKQIDIESRAYMVYSLNASGEADPRFLNGLFSKRGELQPYGRALLALALKARADNRAKQVANEIEGSARVNEFDAHWESRRRPMLDFSEQNDTEATAFSLKALSLISPQSQVLAKAARWLVANRKNGYYWESTKQTAFAIIGLIDYVRVSKELTPDYSLEIFVNDEQVLNRRVTSADARSAQAFLFERKGGAVGGANKIRIVKTGKGMLYLATTASYFTREDEVAANASADLKLTREYLRLKVVGTEGEAKWAVEPLRGELRSGDLIVSRVRVQGGHGQYLMIEDPIPAGCEQVERVSGIDLNYTGTGSNRWTDWYNSREFRDQKSAIFVDYFDGDAVFQVAMRVQVPGEFRVAPARAELMYQPTVHANTASARMTILDKK
ncbi:MAG: MG2 domain-containing protein [Blastocatellia bacterium]